MCTILECQAHFGQKGSPTERQSRRTAVFFVVALKVARGSPKGRKSAPARFLKALPRIGPKTEVHQTLCFTMRNCFRTKNWGRVFSKSVAPLQRQGPFENPSRLPRGALVPIFLVPPPPEPPTTFTAAGGTPCAEALPIIRPDFRPGSTIA